MSTNSNQSFRKLLLIGVFLLAFAFLSQKSQSVQDIYAANGDIYDYMVQDICVEPDGSILSNDPYSCPSGSSRRDLMVGEALPYHKFDQSGHSSDVQISDSFPLIHTDGTFRYVHTLEFAQHAGNLGNWEAPIEYNYDVNLNGTLYPSFDGYNVDEANGTYAGIIGTQDPSGVQLFWAPNCTLNDSWLLFPTNTVNLQWGSLVTQLNISENCPTTFVSSLTLWDKYSAFTYSSGKAMETITSWHFGSSTVASSSHIEKFYYTREYGLARWERWARIGTANSFGCNGPNTDAWGFKRVDCRDWTTNIVANPNGGWKPYNLPIDTRLVPNNLLKNGDLGDGTFVENNPWSRIHYSSTMNWSVLRDNPNSSNIWDRNHHLAFVCTNCSGNAIYQDVQRNSTIVPMNSVLKFGGSFRSDSPASVLIQLFLRDASGQIKQTKNLVINTDANRQNVQSEITLTDNTVTNFRYTIYSLTNNVVIRADDMWLMRAP